MKRVIRPYELVLLSLSAALAHLGTSACTVDCADSRSCGPQELAIVEGPGSGGTSTAQGGSTSITGGAGGTGGSGGSSGGSSPTCNNDTVDAGEVCLDGTPTTTTYNPPFQTVDLIVDDCDGDSNGDILVLLSKPGQSERSVVKAYRSSDGLPGPGTDTETALMVLDPVAFATGQLDTTSGLDVAVAFAGAQPSFLSLSGDGICGFSSLGAGSLDAAPTGIATLELGAGDSRDDIVIAVQPTSVNATLAIVDSGSPSTVESVDTSVTSIGRVIRANVNGDGRDDIVHLDPDEQRAIVRTSDGSGELTGAVLAPLSGATGSVPADIASGNLDGDSNDDLLIVHAVSATARTLINDGGTFSLGPETTMMTPATRVALGDLDADGDIDAVAANTNQTLTLLLNDGSGQFVAHSTIPTESTAPVAVAIHDFNGDGASDIFWLESRQLKVLLALP